MRRRPQRFERVKFRDLDKSAGAALRSMLSSLPWRDEAGWAAGARLRGATWVLGEMARLVAAGGPLPSPLSYFVIERRGEGLVLLRSEATFNAEARGEPGAEVLPRRKELELARVSRCGEDAYDLERTA